MVLEWLPVIGIAIGIDMLCGGKSKKEPAPPKEIKRKHALYPAGDMVELDLMHGTNATNIGRINEEKALVVGSGNSFGTGVYMTTDRNLAEDYAGKNGGVAHMTLQCPKSQVADYSEVKYSREFREWNRQSGISNEGDAIAAYCVNKLGKRYLNVDGKTYVALSDKTDPNERVSFEGLHLTGCTDKKGNPL